MNQNAFYWRALLAVVAVTALFAFVFGRQQKSQGDTQSASSFNPAPAGNKALYVTLHDMRWPVERWQSGLEDLSGKNQALILTRNQLGRWYDLQSSEVQRLLTWIQAGNELILLGDFTDTPDTRLLLERLNFRLPKALTAGERLYQQSREALDAERESIVLQPAPKPTSLESKLNNHFHADARPQQTSIIIQKSSPLPVLPPEAVTLWQTQYFPFIAKIPHGAGVIVWVGSSSLIDNEFLKRAENMRWLLALLQSGPNNSMPERIWFEEGHHGYRTNYALVDLMKEPGLRLAAIQAIMGLLLFLTSQLTRFGSTIPLEKESGRSSMEFIESMAQLYRRANLRNEVIRALYDETRQRIVQKFNLPSRATDEMLNQRLIETFPTLPAWKSMARKYELIYASGHSLSPAAWLKMSRDLIHIKREMI